MFFSGYNYLGMHQVPAFMELVKEGLDRYGVLFPSSRISNTRLELYDAFESVLSALTGSADTVCFASGYLSGLAASGILPANRYAWHQAHPSITSAAKKMEAPAFELWLAGMVEQLNDTGATTQTPLLVFDVINVLNATVPELGLLHALKVPVICLLDDSHGFGQPGMIGHSIFTRLPVNEHIRYVVNYSLSKACHIIAGAVSGSKEDGMALRRSALYTAGTAPSPAWVYAFLNAQALYDQQRQLLQFNINYFQSLVTALPVMHPSPGLPVFLLPATIPEQQLADKGIIISSFAYPDPAGKKLQRIVLSALHTKADLDYLAGCLKQLLAQQ